jgi:hypothetical protein
MGMFEDFEARFGGSEAMWAGMDEAAGPGTTSGGTRLEGRGLPIEWAEEIEPKLTGLWLIKKTLPLVGEALIYGHSGTAKSFLAVDMGMHVALGLEWQGQKVEPGLVVYVGAEGQSGLRNRIVAWRLRHDVKGPIPFALVPCPIDLHDPQADRARLADVVRAAVGRYSIRPALIVVDTVSKTMGAGKENTDDLAVYVSNCGWLAAEFQCCVMPIHHRPKDQESREPRGHSSLRAGMDTIILVEAGKPKKATITKQKDGEERQLLLFNLEPMDLGVDEDGEPVTSCTIVGTDVDTNPIADPFLLAVGKLSPTNRFIYDLLGEVLASSGVPIPPGIPEKEIDSLRVGKVALLEGWRDKAISVAGTEAGQDRDKARDTAKRNFNRARAALQAKGVVKVWDEWVWITYEVGGTTPGQGSGQ